VEDGYHQNPYHNAVHAADVTQAVNCFMLETKVGEGIVFFCFRVGGIDTITVAMQLTVRIRTACRNPVEEIERHASMLSAAKL